MLSPKPHTPGLKLEVLSTETELPRTPSKSHTPFWVPRLKWILDGTGSRVGGAWGFGFRVLGFGLRVRAVRFLELRECRVWGLGLRGPVRGLLGCKGSGFRVYETRHVHVSWRLCSLNNAKSRVGPPGMQGIFSETNC